MQPLEVADPHLEAGFYARGNAGRFNVCRYARETGQRLFQGNQRPPGRDGLAGRAIYDAVAHLVDAGFQVLALADFHAN